MASLSAVLEHIHLDGAAALGEQLVEKVWAGKASHSLLKKHLTAARLRALASKRTGKGGTLAKCIQSGVDNPDSHVGIYATDPECYSVFAELFNPIIKDSHRVEGEIQHPGADFSALSVEEGDLDPEGKYVVSTRIRIARNLEKYGFSAVMSKEECVELEEDVKAALSTLADTPDMPLAGTYTTLAAITDDDKAKLNDEHLLMHNRDKYLESAGCFNHWPTGRGIFISEDRKACVWVGEEDQLRIQSIQRDGNLTQVFQRLGALAEHLAKALPFAQTKQLGAITACPSNLGTGMRASVHIKVPNFCKDPNFKDFCKNLGCQVRGTHGENTEAVGGVYDVSNSRRLGITERQAVLEMANGVKALIAEEKKLEEAQ